MYTSLNMRIHKFLINSRLQIINSNFQKKLKVQKEVLANLKTRKVLLICMFLSNIKNLSLIYSQNVPIIKIIQNLNFSLVENVL